MPIFIDPTGKSTFGIALCDRCKRKFPLGELSPDRNSPGLMVCKADNDEFDPYRLPARQTEKINLPFVRPDVPIGVTPTPMPFTALETEDLLLGIETDDGQGIIVSPDP